MARTRSNVAVIIVMISALAFSTSASKIWRQRLPTVPMPTSLQPLLSPLSADQINRFAKELQQGTILNNDPSFCKHAHAMCEPVDVMPALGTGRWGAEDSGEELNPEITTYFHEKDLLPGATMKLNLHNLYPLRSFLPKSIADALPFSSSKVPEIAQVFKIPQESGMITNMHHTLRDCEGPEANGEIKTCATSMEGMLDFVTGLLGSNLKIMQTTAAAGKAKPETFTVVEVPTHRPAKEKFVACHNEMYPYMVYYCHQIHDTKVFEVKLQAKDGKVLTGVSTCHVNTAKWNPKHVAFQVLHAQPGHTDICHFISESDLVWVPKK